MPRREVTLAAVARNEHRFAGRVALVTGGSSGIGAATAKRLLDEGARVVSLDLGTDAPEGVLALTADVSSSAQVDAAVARATDELGPLDILVCAAGITGASLATVDVTDEEWRRVMAIDADGVFFCNRAVLPRNGGAWLREDRQCCVDRGQGGQPDGHCLLVRQGGRDRDDQGDREGRRPHRGARELHRPPP